jgi:rhamnosyltransferase
MGMLPSDVHSTAAPVAHEPRVCPAKRDVCAVVVTFRPRLADLDNFAKLRPQVQGLVVVDNGSPAEARNLLRVASREWDFELIENEANLGIATALNTGVKWAQARGYAWVALFDQDSMVPPAFIDTMLRAYDISPRRDRIALLVPRYIDSRLGVPLSAIYAGDGSLQVAMTSGSLIPISTFSEEGWFEESLFIDVVDFEYCLRLRSKGYSVEECPEAVLLHAPANFTECRLKGLRLFSTPNYSAGRRYYRDRNKIWILRKYWTRYPSFLLGMLANSLKDGLKILLAEDDKRSKLAHMALGVRDGLMGRMGKTIEL